ncbi:methyl-accepting chemotaxis protein [Paraburkholderia lacunae]|uniref:Chemotaxis protein n=1 Tax=Paraburkholderia lacunae TaxID=2211104 RepID=A0A370N2H1_9BURK|nr:methyl-accepting chemotaxis protein [Paraburkholderia lacunae]RDJ99806.1 chemotaxis protein [Paraburkholderia lacunae]
MAEAEDIDRLIQVLGAESQRTHERGLSASRVLLLSMATILGLGGLLLGVCVWRQVRSLNTGLGDIEETLSEVSRSLDLTCRAPQQRRDEIGRPAGAFNVLLARIEHALGSVRDAAERLRAATQEIVAGNMDLSIRTERQAASLEQTAASMTQLSTTVKQNADNARQANILANQATDLARAGDTVVQRMVGTIERVGQSSGKISDITGIIEALAFQTNILALNAAVEAARAGDQGRGFAVVAGEVRSLAQRSASAAKEIKDLIGSSVAVIFEGTQQAVEVGTAMDGVMQAIHHVADFVEKITAASDEQSRGIEEVSRAVVQMDEVTQQNAALVEESSAVTQSLEMQVADRKEAVSAFGLTGVHI